MFNVVPQMNCVTYWLVTYTRIKRKDRPLIFMLKFFRIKFLKKLQSIIENQQKGCYLMSQSTPGSFCLRTPSDLGTLFLNAQSIQGMQIKLYEFLEHSGTQLMSTQRARGPQTITTRVIKKRHFCSFFIVDCKFCNFVIFILRNFSIKMKDLSFLFVLV